MASRRTSRSGGSRSRRSARASSSNNMAPIMIGGVVLLVVIVVFAMSMTGDDKKNGGAKKSANTANNVAKTNTPKPAGKATAAKPGKEPTRTPPALTDDAIAKADAYYAKAKKQHDDGRRAQAAGDNKKFNKLVNDSWDSLEQLEKFLTPYTGWLEEADLEGWRMPSTYVRLQKRLNTYDKLRGGLRRVKGNRQK